MTKTFNRITGLCLALALAGCGNAEIAVGDPSNDIVGPDVGDEDGAIPGAEAGDGPAQPDGIAPGDGSPDALTDSDGADGAELPPCDPGDGCFGDPCTESEDCLSGWCVDNMGEEVCTKSCEVECPQGWSCKGVDTAGGDKAFICVSDHTNLCRPCLDQNGCKSAQGVEDVCVDYGPDGNFCGSTCAVDEDCPEGFSCQESTTLDGATSNQCVHDSGVCPCASKSIALGLVTSCEVINVLGTCSGIRLCTEAGLTACDAVEALEDVCNGLDDNCDGTVDEAGCDDGDPCTKDTCEGEAGCGKTPLAGLPCDDLSACTTDDHCSAGLCTGTPTDCDDQDPCTLDTCDAQEGCSSQVTNDPCDDGDPCTTADSCSTVGCQGTPVACECTTDSDCAALEDGDYCNGTLVCDLTSLPYVCVVDPPTVVTCDEPEGIDAACLKTFCNGLSGECFTTANNEGVGCDDGDACTWGEVCTSGQCTGAEPANCDDSETCTDDACVAGVGCVNTPIIAFCDDGSVCTGTDTCQNGVCKSGALIDCADDNPCTLDVCDVVAGCQNLPTPGVCDDGDVCSQGDLCLNGQCQGTETFLCDDQNPCSDDSCHPVFGCQYLANAIPCDDGNPCTIFDACDDKACIGGTLADCDDENPCTSDICDSGVGCVQTPVPGGCDDGNPCTIGDVCTDGQCVGTSTGACDDGNPCTDDLCLPDDGCDHVPNAAPCDDGDPCTVGDTCQAQGCQPGAALACDDDNPCTDDACEIGGVCSHTPNSAGCDDNNVCTLLDVCSGGSCSGSDALACDDGNPCTDDLCDITAGCLAVANDDPCDDGSSCTEGDQCQDGACAGGGSFPCDDQNPCTEDTCDDDAGCVFSDNTAGCDDGNPCTSVDKCIQGACYGSSPVDCDDGNECTSDFCDHNSGCVNLANVSPCDDGNPCSTQDYCSNGVCVGTAGIICNDDSPCTDDSCVTGVGCVYTNNTAPCNDGKSCTALDLCSNGVCVGSGEGGCDDGNPCTEDSCTDGGGCTYSQNTAPCNDGNICTDVDTCQGGVCLGTPLVCEAGGSCLSATCDGTLGCVTQPLTPCCGNGAVEDDEVCDDGNTNDGDGCPADCSAGGCPAGSVTAAGYCWVHAVQITGDPGSDHGASCASIGKAKTDVKVSMNWTAQLLSDVAAGFGYNSIGKFNCCAESMWCDHGQQQCGTHNFGNVYWNYGPVNLGYSYEPVYTCFP